MAQPAMCMRVVAFLAFCVLPIPCEGFAPAISGEAILCKTVETFKLADLYHLELSIKASSCGMACHRLGIDPATGSSLLLLTEDEPSKAAQAARHDYLAIDKSPSVEWFGIELASASDAKTLVNELRQRAGEIEAMMRDQATSGSSITGSQDITWTLEYTRMGNGDVGERGRPRHTSKTLCYRRRFHHRPLIHPTTWLRRLFVWKRYGELVWASSSGWCPARSQLSNSFQQQCQYSHYHQPYSSNLPLNTPIIVMFLPYFPRKYPHGSFLKQPPGFSTPLSLTSIVRTVNLAIATLKPLPLFDLTCFMTCTRHMIFFIACHPVPTEQQSKRQLTCQRKRARGTTRGYVAS